MSAKLQQLNWLIVDPNIEVTLPDVTQPQLCLQSAAAQLLKTRAGFRLQNGEQWWEQQLRGFWISSQVNRRGAVIIFSILELSVGALDRRPNRRQGSLTPTSLAVICLFVTIGAVNNNRDSSKFYWENCALRRPIYSDFKHYRCKLSGFVWTMLQRMDGRKEKKWRKFPGKTFQTMICGRMKTKKIIFTHRKY